jgi:osmotically-inducible protein OsmY
MLLAGSLAALVSAPLAFAQTPDRREAAVRRDVTDDQVRDAITETRIRSLMLEKLGDDAMGITVRAAGSKVMLTGHVAKRSTAELSKEVALSVEGVKDVDEDVKTYSGSNPIKKAGKELKDAALESFVKNRILANAGKNAFHAEVEAVDGVISLRGHVSPDARETVLRTARETKGVVKVVDLLNQDARY